MWGRKNFYFGDNISVGVRDLDLAVAWYQEKLGLHLTPLKSETHRTPLRYNISDSFSSLLEIRRMSNLEWESLPR
jgi:hypothetical protein